MYLRGLKPSIAMNLILLLAVAMLLVYFVMVGALRREMLQARQTLGRALLTATGSIIATPDSPPENNRSTAGLSRLMREAEATCILQLNDQAEIIFQYGPDCTVAAALQVEAVKSFNTGREEISFSGKRWGLLWTGRKSLIVTQPATSDSPGAAAIEMSMGGYYQKLRNIQQTFIGYFLINILVLTLFGFYQLYRVLVKPINQLVNTAETFDNYQESVFSQTSREGEFNRLSLALNKMLLRITRDRDKLRQTVDSLEQANTRLRLAQEEIIRAEKLASVGRLSAGIAHEIGNPIGIVLGYLDLLKPENIPPEQKTDFITRAESEVNRINIIIRQLLDFARQPPDENREIIGVHEIIREVVEICRVQPLMAGIAIQLDTGAGNDSIFAIRGQLKQVFINLLINSADALKMAGTTPGENHWIRIMTKNSILNGKPALQIEVIDNGPGITPAQSAVIFDPFYTTKEPGKGTGLGLSICFTIVQDSGGIIRADCDESKMRMTILLPLVGEGEKS